MKKLKRLLAFVLSCTLVFSGIEPFELKAYAATPAPNGYVSFVFEQGALLGRYNDETHQNDSIAADGSNFSSRFTISDSGYPFVYRDEREENGSTYFENYNYFISKGDAKEADGSIRVAVAPPTSKPSTEEARFWKEPAGDPTNNDPAGDPTNNDPSGDPTNNDPSGDPTNNDPAGDPTNNDPSGDPTNNDPNSGEPTGTSGELVFDQEAYDAAVAEWEASFDYATYSDITDDDAYFEMFADGTFALRVKASKLSDYTLNIDYARDDLVKPICIYLKVNETNKYFTYNKAYNEYRVNTDSTDLSGDLTDNNQHHEFDRPVNGIALNELRDGSSVENNVSLIRDNTKFNILQFNCGEGNTVGWTDTGLLEFVINGDTFQFAVGEIKADGTFDDSESTVINRNSDQPGFNAYYETNWGQDGQINATKPTGDPQLVIDPSKKYGLRYVNGPGVELNVFRADLWHSELQIEHFAPQGGYEYDAFVIEPEYFNSENRDDHERDGINRYNLNLNVSFKRLNNVTLKTEGGATLTDVAINDVVIGDINSSGVLLRNDIVGGTCAYWAEGEDEPFASFDRIWYRSATAGYVVEYVTIANPDEEPVKVYFNGYNDRDNRYDARTGIMRHSDGIEFYDPNSFNFDNGDTVESAVIIKDGATVTFHTKDVWAEISSQDYGAMNEDVKLHNAYAESLEDAIKITKDYYEGLSANDRLELERINWDIKKKDISLDDTTLKFYGTQAEDEAIERYLRINLYNSDTEYGTLTVPAGKTLTFPGEIQGDYTLDDDENVTAGAKVVLGNGAKLNVYTVYKEEYLILRNSGNPDDKELRQQGRVHVSEIAGTNATVTVGTENEAEDQDGAHIDVAKATGIAKVIVNPRSNFNSIIDDYDDYRWDNERQENVFMGHVHKDPKSAITIGIIELKGKAIGAREDGGEEGRGGNFHVDENDTLSVGGVTVDRFAHFEVAGKLSTKINTLTVNGCAEFNNVTDAVGNNAQIGAVTVGEFGEFRVNNSKLTIATISDNGRVDINDGSNVTMTTVNVSSERELNVGNSTATITTLNAAVRSRVNFNGNNNSVNVNNFVLADEAGANLDGNVRIENFTVGMRAFVSNRGSVQIGSKNTSSFILNRDTQIRNYGGMYIGATATIYGNSEIRTSGLCQFNGPVKLVKVVSVDEWTGEEFWGSEVKLIRQSSAGESGLPSYFTFRNNITGDIMNPVTWSGVRIAFYYVDDIDYVWPGETCGTDVPDDPDGFNSDPEHYEGGWHFEEVEKYNNQGTIKAFPLGEEAANVPNDNRNLYVLMSSDDGNEQKFYITRNQDGYYSIFPESVTFYVADAENAPEWSENWENEGITEYTENEEVKEFVDTYAILDYIQDANNFSKFEGKKLYVRVDGYIYQESLNLPGGVIVEFFNEDPYAGYEIEVESDDAGINRSWNLNGVGLRIGNRKNLEADAIPSSIQIGLVTLHNAAWLKLSEDLPEPADGFRTFNIAGIEATGNVEDRASDVMAFGYHESGVRGNSKVSVSGNIGVYPGSTLRLNIEGEIAADNVVTEEGSSLEIISDKFTVTDEFNVADNSDVRIDVSGEINIPVTSVGKLASSGSRLEVNGNEFNGSEITVAADSRDIIFNVGALSISNKIEIGTNVDFTGFNVGEFNSPDAEIIIGKESHIFFGAESVNVNKLIVGQGADINAYDDIHDACNVGSYNIGAGGLWIYDGANIDVDEISVAGYTYLTGNSHITLLGYATKNFAGGVRLAWDSGIDGNFQGACLQKVVANSDVVFGKDIEMGYNTGYATMGNADWHGTLPEDKEMRLNFEYRLRDDNNNRSFGSKDMIVAVKSNAKPDVEKIRIDGGANGEQYADYYEETRDDGTYYVLRILGVRVMVSAVGETIEQATLLTTPADYKSAIAYINQIGNNNQKYYVELPGDVRIDETLELPKASSAASFELIGRIRDERTIDENGETRKEYDITEIRFVGDVKILTDTTFTNIRLVSNPKFDTRNDARAKYTANLVTGGKNVVFDRASLQIDKQLNFNESDWSGMTGITGNGNLTVKNLNGAGDFRLTGNMAVKNLTIIQSSVSVGGDATLAGDLNMTGDRDEGWLSANFDIAGTFSVKNATIGERSYVHPAKAASISGDFRAYGDSRIDGMTVNSTFSGNVYLQESGIGIEAGTVSFKKNVYACSAQIELSFDYDNKPEGIADDAWESFRDDFMWRVANHSAGTVNVSVGGNAYLRMTQFAVNGNLTLGNLFVDRDVNVIYGMDNKNSFTVKKVTGVRNEYEPEWGRFPETPFIWATESNWSTDLGWDPVMPYFVAGDNCAKENFNPGVFVEDAEYEGDLYVFEAASESTLNVRKASIEQSLFKGRVDTSNGYVNLGHDVDWNDGGLFAAKIAKLYKADSDAEIVKTAEDSIKFILGAYHSPDAPPCALYALKNAGGKLVIDNRTEAYAILLNVLPNLSQDDYAPLRVGYYDTLDEAFAKIKALNNKTVGYAVNISKAGDVGTADTKNITIPAQAYKIMISNMSDGAVSLKFNNTLAATTNIYMNGISLISAKPVTFTLGNFALDFDECDLTGLAGITAINGGGVNGNSAVSFSFGEDAVEAYKANGNSYAKDSKYDIKVGTVNNVGTLAISNLAFTVTGKVNVGNIDASAYSWYDDTQEANAFFDLEGTYLGGDMSNWNWAGQYRVGDGPDNEPYTEDDIWVDVDTERSYWGSRNNSVAGYTKLIVTVNPAGTKISSKKVGEDVTDTSVIKITPNVTVANDIICNPGIKATAVAGGDGQPDTWDEKTVHQTFTITPCVLSGTDLVSVDEYLSNLYGTQTEVENLIAYRAEGIPFIIAPKAVAENAKFDRWATSNRCIAVEDGMYIKQVAGSAVYICYSDREFAPYTVAKIVDGEEVKIADVMSWQNAVNTIAKAASKQDYVIELNHDSDKDTNDPAVTSEDLAPNTLNTPETLTMPAASAVKSLKIRSAAWQNEDVVPGWFYLGDKLTLTTDTILENINFIGVAQDKKTKEYYVLDETNGNALTISMPVKVTIKGSVSMNGRNTILDGAKKGSLEFESLALLSKDLETSMIPFNIYGIGAVKNMLNVALNGMGAELKTYYATLANYNKTPNKVVTAPEFSATNVTLTGSNENIKLGAGGAVNITNLTLNGGTVDVETGKIVSANFTSNGGALKAVKGTVTITNMTVDGDGDTNIVSDNITVSGKTTVNNDKLVISGYSATDKASTLKLNGAVEVADGCTIKLDAYANVGEDNAYTSIVKAYDDADASVGPYVFAIAPKAASSVVFKAATVNSETGAVTVSEFIGTNTRDEFFLNKKGNNILAYNGYSVKATVSALPMGTDPEATTPELAGFYVSYDDAIASMNDKTKDFYVEVYSNTSSLDEPIKLTAPAAAKAATLTVSAEGDVSVYYSAAPSFANNVTLKSFKLSPVKTAAKGAAHKFTTDGAALAITLSGANTLALVDMEVNGTTNITASAGNLVLSGTGGTISKGNITAKNIDISDAGSEIICCNTITADNLTVSDSRMTGTKLVVKKVLEAKDTSRLEFGTFELNDVIAGDALTIGDESVPIKIAGNVDGKIKLLKYTGEKNLDESLGYLALKKEDVENNKITKVEQFAVLVKGKNVESSDVTVVGETRSDPGAGIVNLSEDFKIVKANGALYLIKTDGDLEANRVTLVHYGSDVKEGDYLDFTQAVNRINEINQPSDVYEIRTYHNVTDTNVTDNVLHSKLVLPADNKSYTLSVNSYGGAGEDTIEYSGAEAVAVFNDVRFISAKLKPVVAATGADSMAASFTLKPNSKAVFKYSNLLLNRQDSLLVKSITGTKGMSRLELTDTTLIAGTGIDAIGTIILNNSDIAIAKLTNIGTIASDDAANEVIVAGTAASNVDNLAGDMVLYTSYTTDKNGNSTNKFTLNGTALAGTVKVWPAKIDKAIDFTAGYDAVKAALGTINEETIDGTIPLLVSKKANASAFEVYGRTYEDSDWVMFKDAKWQVMCDSRENLDVEITGADGFDTYAQSWANAVAIVDSIADKNAEYTFTLLKDETFADAKNGGTAAVKTAGAFVTPKLANVKKITVTSASGEGKLIYTGALNPACSIIFDDVKVEERTKNAANAPYASKINATGAVTVGFTQNAYNSVDGESNNVLTFNTISVPKGTLYLGDSVVIEANGAINAGNVDYDGDVRIVPIADAKKAYAKQTYGTITSDVTGDAPGTLTLSNYFTKALPTAAASQLSITGKVDPAAKINVNMYSAKYTVTVNNGKATYKLATVAAQEDAYEPMPVFGYIDEYLIYTDATKAPVARTALISAPFVSMDRITFTGMDGQDAYEIADYEFVKVAGNFYYTGGGLRRVVDLWIDTDNNDSYDDECDQKENFATWDQAVTELNKITNPDYGFKLALNDDVGQAVIGEKTIVVNKRPEDFRVITAVPMAKLNMPVNVNDLTVEGNGFSFIFSSPAIAVNSNVEFENVSFISLKKVTNKETREDGGKKYTYSVPTFAATPVSISVAANRSVSFNDYHSESIVRYDDWENGRFYELRVGETEFAAITGTATSTFVAQNGGFPTIGKVATFNHVTFLSDGYSEYRITGDLNVTGLTVKNASVDAGNVTVANNTGMKSADLRAVGGGNMKLKNVIVEDEYCTVTAKANAKGVSLLNISGDITDIGGELRVGIMYASANMAAPLYVAFYDGQTVATIANADNLSKITLLLGIGDAEEGHMAGAPAEFDDEGNCTAPGWYLEYVAKSKTVLFKRAAAE